MRPKHLGWLSEQVIGVLCVLAGVAGFFWGAWGGGIAGGLAVGVVVAVMAGFVLSLLREAADQREARERGQEG